MQSCASTSDRHVWIGEGIRAEAMHDRGQFDDAEAIYTKLLDSPPDTERRRWIAYRMAELHKERGDKKQAQDLADQILHEDIKDEYGAKALFLKAEMERWENYEGYSKKALYWGVIERFPDSYEAEKSLKFLEAGRSSEDLGFANRLRKQIDRQKSALTDNLLLAEARTYIKLEKPNKALSALRELFYLDPSESLADNALWEIAAIYRDAQQWKDALATYSLFRERIESSWFVGEYTPDLVNDSIFESGKISLLFLEDYKLAASYFEDYITLFPDTLLADDALWYLSESHRLAGDAKNRKKALERLSDLFPESKYRRRNGKGEDE